MTKLFYITGTDTDVGKTLVSAALLNAFNRLGKTTSAMKPIASGCEKFEGKLRNADALLLQSYASVKLPYEVVNPFAFEPAIAPHIAAQEAQVDINSASLVRHAEHLLSYSADVCIIEGAGGYCVPLNATETLADFAIALKPAIILVVAIRLGCINHALLTIKAIENDGLLLAGWVANLCEPLNALDNGLGTGLDNSLDYERQQQNIASIQAKTKAPLLAKIPKFIDSNHQEKIEHASQLFTDKQLHHLLK